MKQSHDYLFYVVTVIALLGVVASSYLAFIRQENEASLAEQSNQLMEKEAELSAANSTIAELEAELENIKDELDDLADDYRDERNRNEEFEDQIRNLSGTLGNLDKLAKIDEELLQKYSKVYFLNENYVPERLRKIDEEYILEGKDDEYFHAKAMEHLEDLMEAAEDDGMDLKIVSAYRSFDEQLEIKGQYTQVYGSGANTFSADQGYSEHQLGTAVDFTNPTIGNLEESFAQTQEYQWLLDNAHKYGFVLSYPEGNEFYVFEPWHWRFVSTDLARDLDRRDKTFYEMDQREINEYLLEFFD